GATPPHLVRMCERVVRVLITPTIRERIGRNIQHSQHRTPRRLWKQPTPRGGTGNPDPGLLASVDDCRPRHPRSLQGGAALAPSAPGAVASRAAGPVVARVADPVAPTSTDRSRRVRRVPSDVATPAPGARSPESTRAALRSSAVRDS